jgi:hypothetical protein
MHELADRSDIFRLRRSDRQMARLRLVVRGGELSGGWYSMKLSEIIRRSCVFWISICPTLQKRELFISDLMRRVLAV